jgi:arabinoxylan arabinofuranohydrolase
MKFSSVVSILAGTAILTVSGPAQSVGSKKQNVNSAPYPLGNPVIRHMYTADASPHVMPDGRVWMVTSVDSDQGGGYETMHEYHSFSSADLVHWTDHGRIFHIDDIRPADAPATDKYALWAPDMVYRNGQYYLYYPVRILHSDQTNAKGGRVTTAYIGVAVSDSPGHPFKVVNPRMAGTQGIDPAVFVDDDGQPYLYWGSHWAAKLTPNMTELAGKPVKLEVGTDRFMEASWMHKHAGRYYFAYHTKYDWQVKITAANADDPTRARSEIAWSVGDSPLGPFTFGGTLNYELGVNVKNGPRSPAGDFVPWRLTQSNHVGIVEYHGQDYLFYHTSALSSWRQDSFKGEGTWTQRSVCIDKINYGPDGAMLPVQQTIEGVPAVRIDQPKDMILSYSGTGSADGPRVEDFVITPDRSTLTFPQVDLGTGYYYFGVTHEPNAPTFTVEIHLDHADGPLVGTALPACDPATAGYQAVASLRGARGRRDVVFVVKWEGGTPALKLSHFHFFAGAP